MRILVTGGAGFIGSHTVDALLNVGHEVRILDNLDKKIHPEGRPEYINSNAEFILGDVRDKDAWRKALKGMDAVFHFAAYQDYLPDFSTYFHVNAVGTSLLYETAVEDKIPLKRIVVASSQAVAGEGLYKDSRGREIVPGQRSPAQLSKGIWDHTDPETGESLIWQYTPERITTPWNQYAISKYTQELQAINFGRQYDLPSTALRYSIVQGSRQSFFNAYSGACRIFSLSLYFGRAPVCFEDGQSLRDYVNIHDVIKANMIVLEDDRAVGQVINVGGGQAYTVEEFARICIEVFGIDIQPVIPGEYRFGDTRHIVSDISPLRSLGWEPTHTPADSIREYRDYLIEQVKVEDILEHAENHMKQLGVVRTTD